jgi:hypothetical protein
MWHFGRLVLSAILFDFLGIGAVIATIGWYVSNHYLKIHRVLTVDQSGMRHLLMKPGCSNIHVNS